MILFTNKRFFIVIPTTHILIPLISKLNFQIEQFSINHDEQYISLIISFAKKKKEKIHNWDPATHILLYFNFYTQLQNWTIT